MAQRRKVEGEINVIRDKGLSKDAVKELHEKILVSTLLYGSETMTWYKYNKSSEVITF